MRVTQAVNMLRDHGYKAFICAEGVVAIGKATFIEIMPRDDDKADAYTTFDVVEIAATPCVDDNAIRAFCGY